MEIKKIVFWLLVIGAVALVTGVTIGAFTLDAAELTRQIAECGEKINSSGCGFNWEYSK